MCLLGCILNIYLNELLFANNGIVVMFIFYKFTFFPMFVEYLYVFEFKIH